MLEHEPCIASVEGQKVTAFFWMSVYTMYVYRHPFYKTKILDQPLVSVLAKLKLLSVHKKCTCIWYWYQVINFIFRTFFEIFPICKIRNRGGALTFVQCIGIFRHKKPWVQDIYCLSKHLGLTLWVKDLQIITLILCDRKSPGAASRGIRDQVATDHWWTINFTLCNCFIKHCFSWHPRIPDAISKSSSFIRPKITFPDRRR